MHIGLPRMQLLTIYIIKAICLFSFSSHSHPLVFLSFSIFSFSPHFPSLCLCRWAIWPLKGKRAVPVLSVQRRQTEDTQAVVEAGLVRGIYSRNTTRRCRYSTGTTCVWVCLWGMGV